MEADSSRYVCIHGHFYQPPRENPWLEAVEVQDSAAPYHDWNERITAECYAPNSASRILDSDRLIVDIASNYAKISFNFGPTLLSWMERESPRTYQAILDADLAGMMEHSGHGAAMAQVYNHMIMPLASAADKKTQIIWGIRDFEHRFKRRPEGMWLAETAVDMESLELLAAHQIAFTILAPHQAARFRKTGEGDWIETDTAGIDPRRAYLCRLPSGKTISLFFYDGPISQAVAFEKLLESGDRLTERLMGGFSEEADWPQLLHIATDGETYGHHQKFGDMALAAALRNIESTGTARLTNYGEYLEKHPPQYEVEIRENTSWSCSHGVERWRSDCGCNSGGYQHWNQQWRAPLRASLDWLRDRLAVEYSRSGARFLKDPWRARDEYIQVILDRGPEQIERFLLEQGKGNLDSNENSTVLMLLEMQRHAMLMYTSCGWFFDELSGPETVQVIQYASRALQLAAGISDLERGLEKQFLEKLRLATSNIPSIGTGAALYERFVLPARVDLNKVAAHFAFSSLFEEYQESTRIFCYTVSREEYVRVASEEAVMAAGRIIVTSDITGGKAYLTFCVVRLGSHDFKGCISHEYDAATFAAFRDEALSAFDRGLYTQIIGLMDSTFGTHNYSLVHLFRDEQRKILSAIINTTMEQFTEAFLRMYEHSRPLIEFVHEIGLPVPQSFLNAAQPALNALVKNVLTEDEVDGETVRRLIEQIVKWQVNTISPDTELSVQRTMEDLMHALESDPANLQLLARIQKVMELIKALPNQMALWQVQNYYYHLARTRYPDMVRECRSTVDAAAWVEMFRAIGQLLAFNMDALLPEKC